MGDCLLPVYQPITHTHTHHFLCVDQIEEVCFRAASLCRNTAGFYKILTRNQKTDKWEQRTCSSLTHDSRRDGSGSPEDASYKQGSQLALSVKLWSRAETKRILLLRQQYTVCMIDSDPLCLLSVCLCLTSERGSCGGFILGDCGSGHWFDSPPCQSVLGQDTEPQTAPDVLVGTLGSATTINVWMYVWINVNNFGQKSLINALKCKYKYCHRGQEKEKEPCWHHQSLSERWGFHLEAFRATAQRRRSTQKKTLLLWAAACCCRRCVDTVSLRTVGTMWGQCVDTAWTLHAAQPELTCCSAPHAAVG